MINNIISFVMKNCIHTSQPLQFFAFESIHPNYLYMKNRNSGLMGGGKRFFSKKFRRKEKCKK